MGELSTKWASSCFVLMTRVELFVPGWLKDGGGRALWSWTSVLAIVGSDGLNAYRCLEPEQLPTLFEESVQTELLSGGHLQADSPRLMALPGIGVLVSATQWVQVLLGSRAGGPESVGAATASETCVRLFQNGGASSFTDRASFGQLNDLLMVARLLRNFGGLGPPGALGGDLWKGGHV